MIIITTVQEVRDFLAPLRKSKSLGFVPTMGALHEGHMALIDTSVKENDYTICSIFVNPTQFNQKEDLIKYPRLLEKDLELLDKHDCDMVFFPKVDEMYPADLDTSVEMDYKGIDKAMEGEFRPGHFAGVAQVIKRFLDILEPSVIYMGQKDYQQVALVRLVQETFNLSVRVGMVPTVRHEDGLAQSSRNLRLTPVHRQKANVIFRTLTWAREQVKNRPIKEVEEVAMANLAIPGFRPEYFTLVNGDTLDPISDWSDAKHIVACTAVWAGDVRLIDNMTLREG
jgi:pantoate--beta-alanine ligase